MLNFLQFFIETEQHLITSSAEPGSADDTFESKSSRNFFNGLMENININIKEMMGANYKSLCPYLELYKILFIYMFYK